MFRSDGYPQSLAPQIFNTALQRAEDRGNTGGMSEIGKEYDTAVAELTFNSHPIINTLTMIAKENIKYANDIVNVIENRIKNVSTPRSSFRFKIQFSFNFSWILFSLSSYNLSRNYFNPLHIWAYFINN